MLNFTHYKVHPRSMASFSEDSKLLRKSGVHNLTEFEPTKIMNAFTEVKLKNPTQLAVFAISNFLGILLESVQEFLGKCL